VSTRILAAAAGWLAPAKYFNKPWGINTAYFLMPAGVVCLHCGRFPQMFEISPSIFSSGGVQHFVLPVPFSKQKVRTCYKNLFQGHVQRNTSMFLKK
jgi:hypothetical protein